MPSDALELNDWEARAMPDPLKAPVVEKYFGLIAPPIKYSILPGCEFDDL